MAAAQANENIRYEPDDRPPSAAAIGAGVQAAMVIVALVVLTVVPETLKFLQHRRSRCGWGLV